MREFLLSRIGTPTFSIVLSLSVGLAFWGAVSNRPILALVGIGFFVSLILVYGLTLVRMVAEFRKLRRDIVVIQERLLRQRERGWASRYFLINVWEEQNTPSGEEDGNAP